MPKKTKLKVRITKDRDGDYAHMIKETKDKTKTIPIEMPEAVALVKKMGLVRENPGDKVTYIYS